MSIATRTLRTANFMLLAFALMLLTSTGATATTRHTSTTKHASSRNHSSKHVSKASYKTRGQHSIDESRTREIQSALIREHYMTGDPTGVWDQSSKDAMIRYQAANGWQTKITPDSRALIKLGLGPDHKGLLNPETASIPSPHELGVDNATQPGGAADSE